VLVRGFPLVVNLAEANGRAHPDIGFFSVGSGAADVSEAAGESHLIARRDGKVAHLVADMIENGLPERPTYPRKNPGISALRRVRRLKIWIAYLRAFV